MAHLRWRHAFMLSWATIGVCLTCDADGIETTQEILKTRERATVLLQVTGTSQRLNASRSRTHIEEDIRRGPRSQLGARAKSKDTDDSHEPLVPDQQRRWAPGRGRPLEENTADVQTWAQEVEEAPMEEANSEWSAQADGSSSVAAAAYSDEDGSSDTDAEEGDAEDSVGNEEAGTEAVEAEGADTEEGDVENVAGEDDAPSDTEVDDAVEKSTRKEHRQMKDSLSLADSNRFAVPLNEKGYESIADLRSNHGMELFVRRLASQLGLRIVDKGGLKGFVPYYSGQKDTQSFEALQKELAAAAEEGTWVKFTPSSRQKEHILIQTEETRNEATKSSEAQSASLGYRALKLFVRIPQATYDLFGYTSSAIICGTFLAAALCLIDERKRTTKELNTFLEPPLLNASPMPPIILENALATKKLEDLRFEKR